MDDIDRAQIGQKREEAYEILNHPIIPKTNLPPMKAKGIGKKRTRLYFRTGIILVILIFLVIFSLKLIGFW